MTVELVVEIYEASEIKMLQKLPIEILLKIFEFLPSVISVKNCRLVCKSWKQTVETLDILRNQTRLRINPFNMKEVLQSDIVQLIGEIKLEMFNIKDRKKLNLVLQKIHTMDLRLENLNLSCQNGVDPRKLAALFSNISKLTISDVTFWNNTRSSGWHHILSDILTRENLALQSMHVNGSRKIENVDLSLFAASISRLSKISIKIHDPNYSEALLESIVENQLVNLNVLNLRYSHLQNVDREVLANAVVKVREVNLYGTGLTSDQQECIYQIIDKCDSNSLLLKVLDLRSNHEIESYDFLNSFLKLMDFKASLKKDQVKAIFDKICETKQVTLLRCLILPTDEYWEPDDYPEELLLNIRNKLEICQWGNIPSFKQYAIHM